MTPADYWKSNKYLYHITPPGDEWPEGFDVHHVLRKKIPGEVLDYGCGKGRMVEAFDPKDYIGVDINPSAVEFCRHTYPEYDFYVLSDLPKVETILAYTVLLHVPDDEIEALISEFAESADRVIIAEILGREWRREGDPPVFNRDLVEYTAMFMQNGMYRKHLDEFPYRRYGDVYISVIEYAHA